MKAKISKVSTLKYEDYREIKTLEELLSLLDEFDEDIIIHNNSAEPNYDIDVTIYDDYYE